MLGAELAELLVRYLRYTEIVRALECDLTQPLIGAPALLSAIAAHRERPHGNQPQGGPGAGGDQGGRLLESNAMIGRYEMVVECSLQTRGRYDAGREWDEPLLADLDAMLDCG